MDQETRLILQALKNLQENQTELGNAICALAGRRNYEMTTKINTKSIKKVLDDEKYL